MAAQGIRILTQNSQNPVEADRVAGSEYFEDDLRRVDRLLDDLRAVDVILRVEGGRLIFNAPPGVMSDDLIGRLRADRETVLEILREMIESPASPRVRRCRVHLMPFDAVETTDPSRGGWVRVACRWCGRFLGYSPR
jgi:hypothetical protein